MKACCKDIVQVSIVIDKIEQAQREYGIEGITFLGGKPFLQARGLAEVAHACQQRGLSVMIFSGYTLLRS